MKEPWDEKNIKHKDLGLVEVKVSDIADYPDDLGEGLNCCIQLDKAHKLGLYIPDSEQSEKTIKQILEESSKSPDKVKECLKSYCGVLYKILNGKKKIRNENDYIFLAEYKGKYYPFGSGHHRICIAKRTNLDYIIANVIKFYD